MQSLIQRGRSFLTPTGSSANVKNAGSFSTAKSEDALFPRTDPAVDGEECLHDCSECTVHYPAKFSIDEDDKLFGQVKGWDTHLVVGTGKTDWVRDVTDEKGSVMEAVGKYGQEIQMSSGRGQGKVMLSASNMPASSEHDHDEGSDCMLLPSWTFIENVKPEQVPDLMQNIVANSVSNRTPLDGLKVEPHQSDVHSSTDTPNGASTPLEMGPSHTNGSQHTEPVDVAALTINPPLAASQFSTRPIPHRALILMCSHKTRDARCGQSAPLLRKEFERILRPMGLHRDLHDSRPGGVGIYFINHVGGHKYSANVMIYRRAGSKAISSSEPKEEEIKDEAVQGIWLARVRPEDCENIVRYTVLQGKLVKPKSQLRGGFDREKGLASW
ncbi:uncharacterized protein HMPREF1541_02455 [Cyphellophora europaea CBS 101466]|uniref:Sucrase/ferredoxin-like family protein n=1 Tax=Cyphellophora europaea (strain CBS 101466) TaxID=1220924 RepID=W2S3L4_CYPE1|nr:uncharacterized protein HMPREF1541_02455 [Cyphellophora europaea CBS 101466]ETN43296.1 hypothetical protein HMPREF1541_02455 [Cyphellophora europaea CBS 101466]